MLQARSQGGSGGSAEPPIELNHPLIQAESPSLM
jgi:hypothetical protein